MRIADILTEQMEEEEELGDTQKKRRRVIFYNKSSSSSLRSLLSRWLSRRKSGPGRSFPVSDRPVLEPDRVSTEETSSGGKHRDMISFNIGMGIGLVFLLAKSASEVNKMTELRAQTEMLLKEVRAEVRNKDAIASSSESNNKISISPTQCCGDASTRMAISMDVCNEPYDYEGTKHDAESGSQSYYESASGNTRSLSIDQMEAELEVELERLETNLEGETSSVHQCGVKLDNESDGPSFESFSVNDEEDDIVPNNTQEFYGVSAFELERKLHELLATRQEEQIEELQSALECMKKKLLEKEMELRWWKETNGFALQNEEKHRTSDRCENCHSSASAISIYPSFEGL